LISLSRFQLVLWTVLLLSALLTAALTNLMAPPDSTPLAIKIRPEIWGLLGLGLFSVVAAPAITQNRRTAPVSRSLSTESRSERVNARSTTVAAVAHEQALTASPHFEGDVMVKADPKDARWIDLIRGDNDGSEHIDISKLQQLAITALLVTIYGVSLWRMMLGVANIDEFPDIDVGFVALLGMSHAAYLADKQVSST
jgi:hypothetical protein